MAHAPVIVHDLAHARAALDAARALGAPLTLQSAPGAGHYLGTAYFRALLAVLRTEHPGSDWRFILDCGDDAGLAQNALRAGLADVMFHGPAATARRLNAIAAGFGATLHRPARRPPERLDLLDCPTPYETVRQWLSTGGKHLQRADPSALAGGKRN